MAKRVSGKTKPVEAPTTCGLGQALLVLQDGWSPVKEAAFRALKKRKDLPKEDGLREALVGGLADGTLGHSGTLVLMQIDYVADKRGLLERRDGERQVLEQNYVIPPDQRDIDEVDFYASLLPVTALRPTYQKLVVDGLYACVRDIRVPIVDLVKLDVSALPKKNKGGAPFKISWDRFWIEIICQRYLEPKLRDDDDDWKELNTVLRRKFVEEIDESYIRSKTRSLRNELRARGLLKSSDKS